MNFRETPMKISVPKKKWAQAGHKRCFEKLAKHVTNHYPKDSALHKAVRDAFKSMNDAALKLEKSAKKKAAPKRPRKRTTARKRATARKRRGVVRRRTARRSAPRRRSAAARRTTARRPGIRRRKSA